MPATTTVAFSRALASEAVRWRRSAATQLPLLAAALGLLQLGPVLATAPSPSWTPVLAHQNPWAVFAGPLAVVLLVGTVSRADRAADAEGR